MPIPERTRRARWLLGAAAAAGIIAVAAIAVVFVRSQSASESRMPFPLTADPPTDSVSFADFVGSDACAACHAAQHSAWASSTHANAGQAPPRDLLLRRFDGRPLRFSDATVEPRGDGAGGYEFVVQWQGRTDRFPVLGVVGGGHMIGGGTQGFLWRHPDGTVRLLPFEIAGSDSTWFCASSVRADRGWVPITDSLSIADCNDFPPSRVFGSSARNVNCQECHGSQIQLQPPGTPERTRFTSLSINCESCHGPGRRHVQRVNAADSNADIAMPALATLSRDESVALCLRCHAVKSEVRRGFLPGLELEEFYSLTYPALDGSQVHADGRTRKFAYQQGHLYSDCYLSGSMTCVDCHEPHAQQYRDINGRALEGRFDDGQCTACHASKADQPELHTRHARNSEGSRCTSCHMPFVQEPAVGQQIRYTRSDHTIANPRPALDRRLAIPNACQTCHVDRGAEQLERETRELWGEPKPLRPIIAVLLEDTSTAALERILLASDTTHTQAYADALARYFERLHGPEARAVSGRISARLWDLTRSLDDDVSALALAALHYDAGDSGNVRRRLVQRVSDMGARERSVRRRWALALASRGDALRERRLYEESAVSYRKALELLPDNAELLQTFGMVRLAAGDLAGASEALTRAIALDPSNSLAYVNLGRVRAAAGNRIGEEEAYRAALHADPTDALVYLNLGNTLAAAGRRDEAADLFRRAIDLDLSLAPAHFNLARMLLYQDRRADALASIRRGLMFDPDHFEARQAAAELEAALSQR